LNKTEIKKEFIKINKSLDKIMSKATCADIDIQVAIKISTINKLAKDLQNEIG